MIDDVTAHSHQIRLTSLSVLLKDCTWVAVCIGILFIFHQAMKSKLQVGSQWFFVHAIGNLVVTLSAIRDAVATVLEPLTSVTGPYSIFPIYMVGAIHLYHIIFFRPLRREDWFHHIVFGGAICGIGLVFTCGPLLGLIAFFLCGLPGGLDYAMLVAVKQGALHPLTEKRWNARIMTWIRAPGCALISFLLYVGMRYSTRVFSPLEVVAGAAVALLVLINGQYYSQQVVGNAYTRDPKITQTGC